MDDISVLQAAAALGVDPSRVQKLLRTGGLPGRRLGRDWLVDGDAVAKLAQHPHRGGRPMAPARAWGLLDLLEGGNASWLSPVARSQVRAQVRNLAGAEAGRWRDALRARSQVRSVRVHPSALARIADDTQSGVLVAGAERAVASGADLVALAPLAEIYLPADQWLRFTARWHPRDHSPEPNLRVHVPQGEIWPFTRAGEVGPAALAADLLDSLEPRAVTAGAAKLNTLAAGR